LLYSLDGGARWLEAGATAAPATLGVLASVPAAASAALVDRRSACEVVLAHPGMSLTNATESALDAGANLAMCGDELIQFATATQIGATRWRLSTLYRGRRGSEAAIGKQVPGDRFVVVERDTMLALNLPLAALGGTVRILASGIGDVAAPAAAQCAVGGASVLPPAPVALRWQESGDGGGLLGWTRRSRAGWRWIDGVDAPLVEERERYRVTLDTPAASRSVETDAPLLALTAADRAGGVAIGVRQIGSFGESAAATCFIPAWKA
jgi:hypothetical protein